MEPTIPGNPDLPNGEVVITKKNVDNMEDVFLPNEVIIAKDIPPSSDLTGFSSSNFNISPSSSVEPLMMQSQGFPSNEMSSLPRSADGGTKPPSEADLLILLRQQIEYYFSKDNISSDKYLLSQMDGDHYVPISVLASFNQVKRLTSDNDFLIKAIKESHVLQIDPTLTKVRAIPEKRCILILREIPKETPKEEIEQLFTGQNCPKTISCEFAENDCWYVTFSGEEDAQEAHRYLREEVREFHGNPIRARIKNMASQRSSSVPKPRPQFPYPISMSPMPFYPPQSPGTVGWSFIDPRFTSNQYPNGYQSQSGFSGSSGGGARNYSVGSTDRIERREGVNNREGGGVRRGSTGGSGKRYEGDKRPIPSGGRYPGNHFNRRPDNLPNRLRNKRNEEMGHAPMGGNNPSNTTSGSSNNRSNDVVKEVGVGSGQSSNEYNKKDTRKQHQQKTVNRSQQKLDLAPVNFPPLPTSTDSVAPLPPAENEEGNPKLADIVKGKKQDKGNGSVTNDSKSITPPTSNATVSATPTSDTKTSQSNSVVTSPVATATNTTTPTIGAPVIKSTKVSDATKTNNGGVKEPNNKGYPRNSSGSGGNNRSSRHKEYSNNSRRQQTSSVANSSNNSGSSNTGGSNTRQKQSSPTTVKRPLQSSSSLPSSTTTSDTKDEEPAPLSATDVASSKLPEKLSYAQMAQQKPKPSPQKQLSSKTTTGPSSPPAGEPPSSPPLDTSPPPSTQPVTIITSINTESTPSP